MGNATVLYSLFFLFSLISGFLGTNNISRLLMAFKLLLVNSKLKILLIIYEDTNIDTLILYIHTITIIFDFDLAPSFYQNDR